MDSCPICWESLEPQIGTYYMQKCNKCGCVVDVYWYGYDIIIDGKCFHFDESGYGHKEANEALDAYCKERNANKS